MKVVELGVFFTRGEGFLSRLIARVTKGMWSHTGIVCKLRNGRLVYYEALAGRGVQGPEDIARLTKWQARKRGRKLIVLMTPELSKFARRKWKMLESYKTWTTYSVGALFLHWLKARFGVDMLKDSPDKLICSEMVSRILAPEYIIPDGNIKNHDSVTPNDVWNFLQNKPYEIFTGGKHGTET